MRGYLGRLIAVALVDILPQAAIAETLQGIVTHIRDGDTIEVDGTPIRLDGLAAPERAEPGGAAATAEMHRIVEEAGGQLVCELSGAMSYDRYIGICFTPAGDDVSALMVARGVARDCPRYSHGRYAQFETAESRALPFPNYCQPR